MTTSIGLFLYVSTDPTRVQPIFALVVVYGLSRALASPAVRALAIDIAPPESIERVIALRSVAFQAGGILGPVAAGFLFVADIAAPYAVSAVASRCGLVSATPNSTRARHAAGCSPARCVASASSGVNPSSLERSHSICSLCSLAGLSLLPAIAEERLGVGAVGSGTSGCDQHRCCHHGLALSFRPVRRHVGVILLGVVGAFGSCTLRSPSTAALCVLLQPLRSTRFRYSFVRHSSPRDAGGRGRVLAVENVFIGASNEMGAVESGAAAVLALSAPWCSAASARSWWSACGGGSFQRFAMSTVSTRSSDLALTRGGEAPCGLRCQPAWHRTHDQAIEAGRVRDLIEQAALHVEVGQRAEVLAGQRHQPGYPSGSCSGGATGSCT